MRTVIAAILSALWLAGCVVEEEGCYFDEDCGEGFICDTATGTCLPLEEDIDYPGGDSSLPDLNDIEQNDTQTPDTTDTATDKDMAVESDIIVDTDTITDTDVPVDADTTGDTDTFTDTDTVIDTDVGVDTDTIVDSDMGPEEDAPPLDEDEVIVDTLPDTDTACTGCACEDCSGHGTCTTANGYVECLCETGYGGGYCQQCDIEWQDHDGDGICEADDCAHATDPIDGWLDCGEHGVCDDWGFEADCTCDTYWTDMTGECDYCIAGDPNDC